MKPTVVRLPFPPFGLAALCIWIVLAGAAVAAEKQVVIPFDFVSQFDKGRYGRLVGEMLWKKLQRDGGYVIPETMLDVRQTCAANHHHPAPDMPLKEISKIVREDFGAEIGIWGSVERVPGHPGDVYDLVIKCVDFSGSQPRVIYRCNARTRTVSEIPHKYGAELLSALCGRKPGAPPPEPAVEKNWRENPNLVVGDFQRGSGGVPDGWEPQWEAGEVKQREPLGKTVRWVPEAGNPANRVIRFTLSKRIGDTTGVAYYGKLFAVAEGAKYRFQCCWRSDAPAVKVFIKCYDEVGTPYRREGGRRTGNNELPLASARHRGSPTEWAGQVREVYRSQHNLSGPKNQWNTHTGDFTPRHTRYTPRWGRVMLYAYGDAGVVEFDDVVVKQIVPPSTAEQIKQP